jgi:hypothetical protein
MVFMLAVLESENLVDCYALDNTNVLLMCVIYNTYMTGGKITQSVEGLHYRLKVRGFVFRLPTQARNSCLLQSSTGSGAHTNSCARGKCGPFLGEQKIE